MDWLVDPEVVQSFVSDALSKQVTQFSIAFAMAAWIHANKVKKEIAAQGEGFRKVLLDIVSALRQDLTAQQETLAKLVETVNAFDARIKAIEKNKEDS